MRAMILAAMILAGCVGCETDSQAGGYGTGAQCEPCVQDGDCGVGLACQHGYVIESKGPRTFWYCKRPVDFPVNLCPLECHYGTGSACPKKGG